MSKEKKTAADTTALAAELKECIFCKIIRRELPCAKIYEDKEFLAFLDIRPINPGHALIIPKIHCKNLLDFPKSEETDLFEFIKKVATAVVKTVNADGFNLGMNNGEAAGQVVHHAHFHIIPRFSNDGLHHWPNKQYAEGEMQQMQKRIISLL
jgi:histidine triad (HIT) family protein